MRPLQMNWCLLQYQKDGAFDDSTKFTCKEAKPLYDDHLKSVKEYRMAQKTPFYELQDKMFRLARFVVSLLTELDL
jgi:hypothetical protein